VLESLSGENMKQTRQLKRPRKPDTGRVMKTVSLSFDPDTVDRLGWLQRCYAQSRSAFVEDMVRGWIREMETKIRKDPNCYEARLLRDRYPAEFALRYPELAGTNSKAS